MAVTQRPGLIGALLIGVATAKAIAYAARKPLVMVDHLHGHIAASWLDPVALDPPFVSLIASGGHTRLDLVRDLRHPVPLGQTIDDAAGEAIDKGARLLGLGYPGRPRARAPRRHRLADRPRLPGGPARGRASATSRSRASRRRSCTPSATRPTPCPSRRAPTWRPPTRRRSCGRSPTG